MSLRLSNIAVEGLSVGGIETCLAFPELKFAFDIGRCPPEAVKQRLILFTHAHMDHMGGVAYHCATRALRNMPPPTYVVPPHAAEELEELFDVWRRLDRSDMPHTTVAVGPGEEHALGNGSVARPFRAPHSAPCQGYGIWAMRRKLKPEYEGLPGEELRRLRVDEGLVITDEVHTPEVAFTGDSLIEVIEREDVCRSARLLIMETTFIDDRLTVEECRSRGHIHLDEVIERADLFQNEAILMTHFSPRYKAGEIRATLERRLPPSLRRRVTPLLNGFGGGSG